MPNITINEISQNYSYNVGTSTYATVAIPITASWGPALMQDELFNSGIAGSDTSKTIMEKFDNVQWYQFPSTQEGMQAFISAYRGPASNYKSAKDYSFQMAMTYLASGYDVLVCRVASGAIAESSNINVASPGQSGFSIKLKTKYSGSFGNNIVVAMKSVPLKVVNNIQIYYHNAIVFISDPTTGAKTAVENLVFVFDVENETDSIPYYEDIKSNFISVITSVDVDPETSGAPTGTPTDAAQVQNGSNILFTGGTDCFAVDTAASSTGISNMMGAAPPSPSGTGGVGASYFANLRYSLSNIIAGGSAYDVINDPTHAPVYVQKLYAMSKIPSESEPNPYFPTDGSSANVIRCREFNYTAAFLALTMLMDRLNYNPQRIAVAGWDDQNFDTLNFNRTGYTGRIDCVSPLHRKIMEVSYYSRCACGMLDIPKSCPRKYVSSTDTVNGIGYAQLLSQDRLSSTTYVDADALLYPSHVALFAPWGKYRFVGMGKAYTAPPSFLAMLIQRAMVLNQTVQYEWALPTNRIHNLAIGEMDYKTPKHILDAWQASSGVSVNAITEIPGQGVTVWGNSTLFDVPPATYNALQNLSTRYLIDAVKDIVFKCGISITFQYNNEQAYNKFYVGVTPLLDTMRVVGAIEDYYVSMAPDINGLDQVNANSVIGTVVLIVNGVITDITVDLIALPPGSDLTQFGQ